MKPFTTPIPQKLPSEVYQISDIYAGERIRQVGADGHTLFRAVFPPEPFFSLGKFRAAWWVLTGRAHALRWPYPGELEARLGPHPAEEDLANVVDLVHQHCEAGVITKILAGMINRRRRAKSVNECVAEAKRHIEATRRAGA